MWGHDRDPAAQRHEPIGPSFRAVAPTPMGGWLLVNPRAGSGSRSDELCAAAARRGIATHVLGPDEDASALALGARADALGCAGGDGTLAAVAAVAIERG